LFWAVAWLIVTAPMGGCSPPGRSDVIDAADLPGVGSHMELSSGWKVMPGDDYEWRLPTFDDGDWPEITETASSRQVPGGWNGIGWFRMAFRVSENLRRRTVALYVHQFGACELFLNGEFIGGFGVVGADPESEIRRHEGALRPIIVRLSSNEVQVLAIRYSNFATDVLDPYGTQFRPRVFIAGYEPGADVVLYRARYQELRKGLFTGLPAMIALIYFLLFAFYPAARENFHYAVLCAAFAWLNYSVWDLQVTTDPNDALRLELTIKLLTVVCSLASLRFVYSIFHQKAPRQFWVFVAVGVVLMATSTLTTMVWANGFTLVALAELLRAVVAAVVRKKPGAWIVGLGSVVFVVCVAIQMLQGIGVLRYSTEAIYTYGLLALLLSMSVYLARDFARTRRRLERRLDQIRALSRDLKAANVKLTDYSRTLEERVELRTREVSQKNAELERILRELRDTQEQLIMQEKMASLGNLVAGVAHEINNPIGAVHAAADVNARCLDRIEEVAKNYRDDFGKTIELLRDNNRIIQEASSRIATIVKSLRSFARLDEADFQLADVDELIDTTITLLRHELGTRIVVDRVYGDIPRIGCFPNELNQAFMNILVNAIQAIEGKGTIQIRTSSKDGKVVATFSDTGSGMPDNVQHQIFDPGFTTKGVGVGTGLGMSITYRIVKKHRGDIEVRSSAGQGTNVTVTLPTDLVEPV
jgi:two-component system NtrC family sensor kinase